MQAVTLIIDKRPELSAKYKKLLASDYNYVIISKDFLSSIKIIKDMEPDLIIISDSINDDLSDFCRQIRALTYNMRPVIVGISKSADINDRIKVLNSGADDFLSEPINSKEFRVRIEAHLRREFESNLDTKRILPNKNYTLRAIKRAINFEKKWGMLYITIQNFNAYKEAYTELASDKLLQTYSAIIRASISGKDYAGKLGENSFIVITDTIKAEKIAKFLIFAFDTVVSKFYNENDLKRGYLILQGDEFAGKRADFVHFTIGVTSNAISKFKNSGQVLSTLEQLRRMAEQPTKSNYLIDRPKLSGKGSVKQREYNKNIYIYETDEALSTLLYTIFNLQGYNVKIMNEYKLPPAKTEPPALFIVDAGDLEKQNGLKFCAKLKSSAIFRNSKIIATSIIHDKELVLNTGADLYIPKPYEIPAIIKWADSLVKEYNK